MTESAPLSLIASIKDLQTMAKQLSDCQEIALDTEFIRETTFYPKLEILQIANRDQVWLVDVQAFQEKGKIKTKELKPLIDILINPKILKVMHAAHGDQECLLSAFQILAAPIFDTAIGASLCGMGDNIGLGNLLKSTVGVELAKGYARTNWSKRPLPKPVLEYAALDVKYLIQVADLLFERLEKTQRKNWAFELSTRFCEVEVYEVPPEDITKRLAQSGKFNIRDYSVLLELVRWREKRVRELNVPRRWLADDGVLIDMAKIKPTTEEQLQGFRGLSKGEHKAGHAKKILQAIQLGLKNENATPSDLKKRGIQQASSEESRAIDLLRVCVGLISDESQIALKHLVQPNQLLELVRSRFDSEEALLASGLVSNQLDAKGVRNLFLFLRGEMVLSLKKGRVQFLPANRSDIGG